jgi:hypothetical protein
MTERVQSTLDAGLIHVNALVSQILARIISMNGHRGRAEDRFPHGRFGIAWPLRGGRFSSLPWFEKIEKQQGGESDNARREDHSGGLRVHRMRESILEDINSRSKEECREKTDEAPESAAGAGANDQRFGTTHNGFVMHKSTAHGLFFRRIVESEFGLRKSKKIEVLKDGRRIFLFHQAAAGAAGILSLNFASSFHENSTSARRIHAMPAFSGFHVHGHIPPFPRAAGTSARALSGQILARDGNIRKGKLNGK